MIYQNSSWESNLRSEMSPLQVFFQPFSHFSAQSLIYTASVPHFGASEGEILSLWVMLVGLSRSVVLGQQRRLALNVIPVTWSCPRRSLTWGVFCFGRKTRAHPDYYLLLLLLFYPGLWHCAFCLSSCLMLFCLIWFCIKRVCWIFTWMHPPECVSRWIFSCGKTDSLKLPLKCQWKSWAAKQSWRWVGD